MREQNSAPSAAVADDLPIGSHPRYTGTGDRSTLFGYLNTLSVEDLKAIVFWLQRGLSDLSWDNLGGETKTAKARELLIYCERRQQLKLLMQACGGEAPPPVTNVEALKQMIAERFSPDDLEGICFNLGLPREDFRTTRSGMIIDMLEYADRQGRREQLLDAMKRANSAFRP